MAINSKVLDITIDLGGDSLKLVCGCINQDGQLVVGKIVEEGYVTQTGIPAVAFYSKKQSKWLYGYEVDECGELDFTTVVHIKKLFMLCAVKNKNAGGQLSKMDEHNRYYFFNYNHFPKFSLPSENKSTENFDEEIDNGRTFEANCTPREVCLGYFRYIKRILFKRLDALYRQIGNNYVLRFSVVYPPKVGDAYKVVFNRVIEEVFNSTVHRELGTTRALGVYAYQGASENGYSMVEPNENILVFDIGEEFISTSKIFYENQQMRIDGAKGHKRPEALGGVSVDEAIYSYLESGVEDRAVFAEAMDENRANEGCPDSKKYQLLKDIKSAKTILSNKKIQSTGIYENGVDIVIPREFHIQKSLKENELKSCLGIIDPQDNSVADRIYRYIREEAGSPINNDTRTILIAGGVIETLGLDMYIRQRLIKDLGKRVLTCELEPRAISDDFRIYANENSVYASAIGMTLASVKDMEISTVLSLSYGTYVNCELGYGSKARCFSNFVNRGELLTKENNEFSGVFFFRCIPNQFGWIDSVANKEEMFSIALNRKEEENQKYGGYELVVDNGYRGRVAYAYDHKRESRLIIGEPPETKYDVQRRIAQAQFGLERVFYDDIYIWDSEDRNSRRRLRVKFLNCENEFKCREGIIVSKNGGNVIPYVRNITSSATVVTEYWDPMLGRWMSGRMMDVSSLVFDFREGKNFLAEVSDDD
ncbi:MAG: hypothetical protein E7353_05815 [Clostridiales bacterium]|nr:hypothetical protein [Clostridiales bacterium]